MGKVFQRQTTITNIKDVNRVWYLIDATGKPFGRLITSIAMLLSGKKKVNYMPNVDCGDYVVVINAKNVCFSGNKEEDKKYYNVSGRAGGLRVRNAKTMINQYTEELFKRSVHNMMSKCPLSRKKIKRLFVFSDANHNKQAHNLVKYDDSKK